MFKVKAVKGQQVCEIGRYNSTACTGFKGCSRSGLW